MKDFSLPDFLKEEMKKRNISVFKLSQRTGITAPALHNYVAGRRSPQLSIVEEILDALGKKLVVVDKE